MDWLFACVLLALAAGTILYYNRLVYERARARQAWSDVSVQLRRRHDLIPKLVVALRAYADFEENLLESVAWLRTAGDEWTAAKQRARDELALGRSIGRLYAVAEAYPELKASEQWLHLQQNISSVEKDIQHARRYYNGAVKALNVRIDSFPSNLVARLFGFRHAPFFEFEDSRSAQAR